MFKRFLPLLALTALAGLALTTAHASSSTVGLISKSSLGAQTANGATSEVRVSADGHYAVFTSLASDAASGVTDANGLRDVYRRDLTTGVTQAVSVVPAGNATGNDESFSPAVSADGRYVAFVSKASDLTAQPKGLAGATDVYVRDMQTGVTLAVSLVPGGAMTGDAPSAEPQISADGRYVAFSSYATNLTAVADANAAPDVFRRDLATNSTQMASVNSTGAAAGNGGSGAPSLSADGNRLAFHSDASDLSATVTDANAASDVFVRDFNTGATLVASVDVFGTSTGNAQSVGPQISADGVWVAFTSAASDLIFTPVDANGLTDVYERDLNAGVTHLVSQNAAGNGAGNGNSFSPQISGDGRFVAFETLATNLVDGLSDGNSTVDIYQRDTVAGVAALVSHNSAGAGAGNSTSSLIAESLDGRFVAFSTLSSDIVSGGLTDTNASLDVFDWDRTNGVNTLVSINAAGTGTGNNGSALPSVSADGRIVAFLSGATDLTPDTDANGATDAFVSLVNAAPVANNDVYSTNEDTQLTVAAPGILANDTDLDNDPLVVGTVVTGPIHGSVTVNPDGSFIYTPNPNFNGTDGFTYRAFDGHAFSNIANVDIAVKAVNDAPVAANDAYSTAQDTVLNVPAAGVLANDTDVDGDTLTVGGLVSGPAHGGLTLNPDGSFAYTPDAGYIGPDSFKYRAFDGQASSNVATVSLTVTATPHAPVAKNDSYTTAEDTALTVAAPGVLANDTDADNDPLTANLVTGPAHGSLTLNANGGFTYTPNANYNGPDSFTYRANDGTANSNTATVSITVTPVNDPPVGVDDSYTTPEDTLLTVNAPGVLSNDTDVDGNPLTVGSLITEPAFGQLALDANGGFSYLPDPGFSGVDLFTYRPYDGTALGNETTVLINVTPVNDPPVAKDDSYTTAEDTTLTVSAPGVLGNDTDADNDPLTANLVTGPAHGSLTLNADGSFTYTPSANYNGPDSFTYRANDGTANSNTATVSITVTPVNDPPVGVDDGYTVAEDGGLIVNAPGVLGNDTDVDGDTLTVGSVMSQPLFGRLIMLETGAFLYVPDQDFFGLDLFTYRPYDGKTLGNQTLVLIDVTPVNDPPAANDDAYTVTPGQTLNVAAPGVLANDTDVDNDPLTANLVTGVAHGSLTLNPDGSFSYTANVGFSGTDTFTYQANDGTDNSNTATVTLTVPNAPPVANDDSYTTAEGAALTVAAPGVLANDTDANGDPLTAKVVSGPAHGTLTLNANGGFTYTPFAHYNGPDGFTYKANDGKANSEVGSVSITVTPVNDPPVAKDDGYSTQEDTPLTVSAAGVLGNDTDPDGDALTAVQVTGPSHGTLTLNPGGSFIYTPNANFNGTDSFTYRAFDGQAFSNVATVTLTVTAVNDAPVANPDSYTTAEDTTLTVAAPGVLGNDTDVDGDTLTPVLQRGPQHGTLKLNANGSFTYTPNADYNGPDSFAYHVTDGQVFSSTVQVSITVTAVDDAPVAGNDTYATARGTTLTVAAPGVLANDTDVDGDPLTAVLVTGPTHGTLALNGDGSFTYTPQVGFSGPETFTYQASDGSLQSAPATVTINVSPNPPASTVDGGVNGSGSVVLNGAVASFSINTKVSKRGVPAGSVTFRPDQKGPSLASTQIMGVIVDGGHARIFGKGKIGQKGGPVFFVIDVTEGVGSAATFGIEVSNGYVGGPAPLKKGIITIQP